ncbi:MULTISPECIES: hypothetical protein [Eubacteriales]|uniref:hypothetical protein n=1 Tax=Eubacteriales TaxID=186802 RepID=UPI001D0997E4|nr:MULTISPECIES: hypothetical protein [Eubacteriales]MCB7039879.1 hypothetical protein [Flavonifractor plautii]MCB7049764.1 hypothetical protein [Intestinimonas butyriciproducens]
MSNMSYCRFTNTRSDLNDCLDAIREDTRLSDVEAKAGRWMFDDFLSFCREYGIIDSYDEETLRALFDGLEKKESDNE